MAKKTAPTTPDYIPYPKAMKILAGRLGATPEELAVWIFIGPDTGGIAAYRNANELNSPPRFYFDSFMGEDYLSPLMACWFRQDDVDRFDPADRYITGAALIERWSNHPGLRPEAFIRAKIAESRLEDIHPICGFTQGTYSEDALYPQMECGLFSLAQVKEIEVEDFGDSQSNDATDTESKPLGFLTHNPIMQQRANEIAADLKQKRKRKVTKNEVAKLLAEERKMDEATVLRRIRKKW